MATAIQATNAESTAITVGKNFSAAENNLLAAYNLKEGDSTTKLAQDLGIKDKNVSIRSLQLIAEQRFQSASHTLNLFSTIMDKVDQLKQRLINKLSN